jgi:hypothetical protein
MKLSTKMALIVAVSAFFYNDASALVTVSKSGFGLFGYEKPFEKRWDYKLNGETVCVAELTCNGGGFNSCKWSAPLTSCELKNATINIYPPVPDEFLQSAENVIIYQVSALVDENIRNGHANGKIMYGENTFVTYAKLKTTLLLLFTQRRKPLYSACCNT